MAFSKSKGIHVKGIVNLVPKNTEDNHSLDLVSEEDRIALVKYTGIRYRKVNNDRNIDVKDYFQKGIDKLLNQLDWGKETVDILICVTQTPQISIPSVACQLHGDLEFEPNTLCYDINSGCSGFVYGLHTVSQLLSGMENEKSRAILCCGDISTSLTDPNDRSVRPIFSDGVSVIGIEKNGGSEITGYFNLETMGKGQNAIRTEIDSEGKSFMRLNGIDVFNYSVIYAPKNIDNLINFSGMKITNADTYVFHQANKLINDSISKKLNLETSKVISTLYEYGNTASASIPITIGAGWNELKKESNWILICGFGVGFSIASALIYFDPKLCLPPEEIDFDE